MYDLICGPEIACPGAFWRLAPPPVTGFRCLLSAAKSCGAYDCRPATPRPVGEDRRPGRRGPPAAPITIGDLVQLVGKAHGAAAVCWAWLATKAVSRLSLSPVQAVTTLSAGFMESHGVTSPHVGRLAVGNSITTAGTDKPKSRRRLQ